LSKLNDNKTNVGSKVYDDRISDLEFWQQRSHKKLTEEDIREINENLTGFFDTLARWDRAEKENGNE